MAAIQPLFTAKVLDDAVRLARQEGNARDGSLWEALLARTGVSEAELAQGLMNWQGIAVVETPDLGALEPVSRTDGGQRPVIAVSLRDEVLLLSEDPWRPEAIAALGSFANANATLALARRGQIAALRGTAHPRSADKSDATASSPASASGVVDFVDKAIARAYADGASDVHFETDRDGVAVKYRLDGVMTFGERFADKGRSEEVISRIKVMAQLDITERRRPQDGRIHWAHPSGQSIDLRVSIMPSIFGEDAVLRLLDKAQLRDGTQRISLDALGFDAPMAQAIRLLSARPHGMLLVTGPTGSGKTTTLYAALSEVNDGLEKVVTIEDPVEYELPGVLQIPVNEKKGLTFATGLRSILRHDPDKILVGEIRDSETAEIAVQSSLTGHTVCSTVHANSVFDVLGRVQHFGIDPFALASALNGIVVQRLLRRVCPCCAKRRPLSQSEKQRLGVEQSCAPHEVPVAAGCDRCRGSGYRGRFVLAEIHEMSDRVRDLIVSKSSMTLLREAVYTNPEDRLLSAALRKVHEGATTLEEVLRVVGVA